MYGEGEAIAGCSKKLRASARPRRHRSNVTGEVSRAHARELNATIILAEASRHSDKSLFLGAKRCATLRQESEGLHGRFSSEQSEPVMQLARGFALFYFQRALQEHVSRVQGQDHALNRDARVRISSEDGRLNRRRASMPRKEGGVNVERGEGRHGEDFFVEDLPIARDDQDIGLLRSENLGEGAVAGGLWLENRNPGLVSKGGDRPPLNRASSASGKIRASYDERELVLALDDGTQDGRSKRRRTKKNDA